MKIRTMRWGYDGGGVACGPVEGSTVVEICVTNGANNFFVCGCRMMEYVKLSVSPMPIFDLFIQANHYDVDWETEIEKINNVVSEVYDFEVGAEPDEMRSSEYINVFHLVLLALEKAVRIPDPDQQEAEDFIDPYVGEDANSIELPELPAEWDEDEEYEDDYIYANNLEIREPDSGDWVGDLRVQCLVEDKDDEKEVYAFASVSLGEYYIYCIYEDDVIDCELSDLVNVTPLEKYEKLEDASNSKYYEVFKRLDTTLRNCE